VSAKGENREPMAAFPDVIETAAPGYFFGPIIDPISDV
jgi:hypothetical protein